MSIEEENRSLAITTAADAVKKLKLGEPISDEDLKWGTKIIDNLMAVEMRRNLSILRAFRANRLND